MFYTVGTVPKSNIKIVERDKMDTPNTQIHDRSPFPAWYKHFNKDVAELS
jgi:hypothetical protein